MFGPYIDCVHVSLISAKLSSNHGEQSVLLILSYVFDTMVPEAFFSYFLLNLSFVDNVFFLHKLTVTTVKKEKENIWEPE